MSSSDTPPDDAVSDRRRFLKRETMLGAALASGQVPRAQGQPAADDPSKILGNPVRPYGDRSPFEQAVRVHKGKTDEVAVGGWSPLHPAANSVTSKVACIRY